jgi:prepilin-type N-terminal cleavage/methylation domain-containing protein
MIGNKRKIKNQNSLLRPAFSWTTEGQANLKNKGGFTLIELLVAIAVFGTVVATVSNIFISVVGSQRKNFNNQEVLDNTRFVLENMGRAVRQSVVATADGSSSSLTLNHPVKGLLAYTLNDGKILENGVSLTSGGVVVDSLTFVVAGNSAADGVQPRVTVSFSVRDKNQKPGVTASMGIQTTITPRNLQIQE